MPSVAKYAESIEVSLDQGAVFREGYWLRSTRKRNGQEWQKSKTLCFLPFLPILFFDQIGQLTSGGRYADALAGSTIRISHADA